MAQNETSVSAQPSWKKNNVSLFHNNEYSLHLGLSSNGMTKPRTENLQDIMSCEPVDACAPPAAHNAFPAMLKPDLCAVYRLGGTPWKAEVNGHTEPANETLQIRDKDEDLYQTIINVNLPSAPLDVSFPHCRIPNL